MSSSVTITRASIERVVFRESWCVRCGAAHSTRAEFKSGGVSICTAYQHPFRVYASRREMTPEDAATLIIALQLALDWIAEEAQQ